MKRKTNYKNIIALALVLILLIAICVPSSYAVGPNSKRRFGALIASALQAINIYAQSTLAPAQNMLDYIADPPGYSRIYDYPWTADWDDEILDRSVIQIWPDYTTIDGVEYTDIWLSHDAAEKFRVNAFDWKSAYNIASESNGTFANGSGTLTGGVPIYNINGTKMSQNFMFTNNGGSNDSWSLSTSQSGNIYWGQWKDYYNNTIGYLSNTNVGTPVYSRAVVLANNDVRFNQTNASGQTLYTINTKSDYYTSSPFDFDWVSGTIPADEPLTSGTGLMIRVPSDSQGLQTFITNNIEFTNEGGVELDFDLHPELKVSVDDLLDILAPIVPVVNTGDIQFSINHEAPIPPIPDTPIIDATVPQVVQPIINEIQNQGDIISQSVPPIIESIPKIDEICNNIDTAPYHDLDTGLDRLPSFFLPFITDLRSALGIWHYVTEWIGQISTTFAFISGCLVGTSIMTPIYAAIAGYMCIKIYRRMTA